MKICSFLPSATEILFALGVGDQVCGVTFECDWPPEAAAKPHVVFTHLPPGLAPAEIDAIVSAAGPEGRSLYFVDLPRLEAIQPDLIILQDLCKVCSIDTPTMEREMGRLGSSPRILSLSPHTLESVFADIALVGSAIGREAESDRLIAALRARVASVRSRVECGRASAKPRHPPRVLCLEWLDPPFQGGHWVPEMVALAGGKAVLARPGEKSVRFAWKQAIAADPEIIVVMPCGFHLDTTIAQYRDLLARSGGLPPGWMEMTAVRDGRVYAVDGTAFFSRPGPRLVDGLEILEAIVNGEGFERLPEASVALLR